MQKSLILTLIATSFVVLRIMQIAIRNKMLNNNSINLKFNLSESPFLFIFET